jgi:hypothetical protein
MSGLLDRAVDAHGGSPPSAGELLRRHGQTQNAETLGQYLRDLETWSAQLMEVISGAVLLPFAA